MLGIAIVLMPSPWLLMGLLTGMGGVWIVSPTIEGLPFEFPGIRPRAVAVIASLVKILSGLGFTMGPAMTGLVTQYHRLAADRLSDPMQPHERRYHCRVAVPQLTSECEDCGGDAELTVSVARWLTMPYIELPPVPVVLLPETARMSSP